MKKKKDTELMDAMKSELEAKELPEEVEAPAVDQPVEKEEDMLEEIDLSIPGDEEEGTPPAGAPAGSPAMCSPSCPGLAPGFFWPLMSLPTHGLGGVMGLCAG